MESSSEDDYFSWLFLINLVAEPSTFNIVLGFVAVALLLLASALVSGAEVAFFSLSPKDIKEIGNDTRKSSKTILDLLDTPRYLLATIIITNNFVNVSIIVISYYIVRFFIDFTIYPILGFIGQVVVVTFVILLFGEVVPKIFAAYNNIRLAHMTAYPLLILKKILKPISKVLVSSTGVIERKLSRKNKNVDLKEIDHAIDLAVGGKASSQEVSILKGIVKFGNITVTQIMRARVDVVAIDYNTDFKGTIKIVKESGFSRIPVYKENDDNVVGILYVKDLLKHIDKKRGFSWQKLIRSPLFIPETKKIDDLLKEFQSKRIHIAIVVDEYGGTSGIITLEDVIEEIIGEIKDEFDQVEDINYTKIDDRNFIFEGKTLLNDVFKILNIDIDTFDDVEGDFDSLAGLVLELAGRIPGKDEQLSHKNFLFTVLSVTKKRITSVKMTILQEDEMLKPNDQTG